ncbi:hypothetical protein [Pseudomonas sp. RW409]|uniref:hypothetical protein n=1 Tax=Pseudomonas sp. RW409 TaxID=2202895 RepID=UPI0011B52D21|nr:hypothetical protein [Pseudomonas sp. RW409]
MIETYNQLSKDSIISIVSAAAAILSLLISYYSSNIARRALKIAEEDHKEKHSTLSTYLINGTMWDTNDKIRFVAFSFSISNSANAPKTITQTDLHLHVYDRAGRTHEITLKPTNKHPTHIDSSKIIEPPINLNARTTISGWLIFEIPRRITETLSIDKYELAFTTSSGERSSLESFLLMRFTNEHKTSQT